MPSYESVARNVQRLTRQRSRLALGVVAASAVAVGSVASLAAGATPAAAAVSSVAPAGPTAQAAPVPAAAVTARAVPVPAAAVTARAVPAHAAGHIAQAVQAQAAAVTWRAFPAQAAAVTWRAFPAQAAAVTWRAFPAHAAAATWPAFSHPGQTSSQSSSGVVRIAAGAQLAAPVQPATATPAASAQPVVAAQPAASAPPQGTTVSTPAAPAAAPAVATPAAPPQPPQPAPQPWQFYDSVTPSALQGQNAVAVYANGSYAAQPSQVAGHTRVMWIDTNGSDPHADVLDVEPGDATPPQAAAWVAQKLNASPTSTAVIYTMRSEWAAVQQAIARLPWWMPSHTKYWIADPTGVRHVVPGSQATQWYWGQNYDISTALPSF